MRSREKARFVYRERALEDVKRRMNQSGGAFDAMFNPDLPVFSPKEGDFCIRILPPTWEDAKHYGFETFVHWGVGADNQRYLCLKQNNEDCPICAEYAELKRTGNEDAAKEIRPSKRVACWIIDRDNENDGPMLWAPGYTFDRALAVLCYKKRTGEVLAIDHPDRGHDVEFRRDGKGKNVKTLGLQVSGRPSPLSDDPQTQDDWLAFIEDHPIPECLQYYDAERIEKVLTGGRPKDGNGSEDRPRTRAERQRPSREEGRWSRRDDLAEDEKEERFDRLAKDRRALRGRSDLDEPEELEERNARRPSANEEPPPRSSRRLEPDDEPELPPRRTMRRRDSEEEFDNGAEERDTRRERLAPRRRSEREDEDAPNEPAEPAGDRYGSRNARRQARRGVEDGIEGGDGRVDEVDRPRQRRREPEGEPPARASRSGTRRELRGDDDRAPARRHPNRVDQRGSSEALLDDEESPY